MTNYYPLISDAIAALDEKTGETRRAYYERARAILADHLRKADPPLSERFIEDERQALEAAIGKVEADVILSEGTWPTPNGLQTQIDHTEDYIGSAAVEASSAEEYIGRATAEASSAEDYIGGATAKVSPAANYTRSAAVEASSFQPDAKLHRERRLAFSGFLILSALWIGDLLYKPPTFADWYDWLRLGGVVFFPALAILSYFTMRKKWSAAQEERAYIVFAPIIFVGAVLVSVALYSAFGRLAATPS